VGAVGAEAAEAEAAGVTAGSLLNRA